MADTHENKPYESVDLDIPLEDGNMTIVQVKGATIHEDGSLYVPVSKRLQMYGVTTSESFEEISIVHSTPKQALEEGILLLDVLHAKSGNVIFSNATKFSIDKVENYATVSNNLNTMQFMWPSKSYLLSYKQKEGHEHALTPHLKVHGDLSSASKTDISYTEKNLLNGDVYYSVVLDNDTGEFIFTQYVKLHNESDVDYMNVNIVKILEHTTPDKFNREIDLHRSGSFETQRAPSYATQQSNTSYKSRGFLKTASTSLNVPPLSSGKSFPEDESDEEEIKKKKKVAQQILNIDMKGRHIKKHCQCSVQAFRTISDEDNDIGRLMYVLYPIEKYTQFSKISKDSIPVLWLKSKEFEDRGVFPGRLDLDIKGDGRVGSGVLKDEYYYNVGTKDFYLTTRFPKTRDLCLKANLEEISSQGKFKVYNYSYSVYNNMDRDSSVLLLIDLAYPNFVSSTVMEAGKSVPLEPYSPLPGEDENRLWKQISVIIPKKESKHYTVSVKVHNM